MKRHALWFLALTFNVAHAELGQDPTLRALQQQAAAADEQRMAQQLDHPVVPTLPKDRAAFGPKSAPITIVAYSDFQCPYCSRGAETVAEVFKKYPKKIRFVFKHLPLSMHQYALPAAKYFEAIAMISPAKAYEFHDEVFKNQSLLTSQGEAFLAETAKKLKVDETKLKKNLESPKIAERLAADAAEAKEAGVSGTPGFNVAGVILKGAYPIEAFSLIIDRKLTKRSTASK